MKTIRWTERERVTNEEVTRVKTSRNILKVGKGKNRGENLINYLIPSIYLMWFNFLSY